MVGVVHDAHLSTMLRSRTQQQNFNRKGTGRFHLFKGFRGRKNQAASFDPMGILFRFYTVIHSFVLLIAKKIVMCFSHLSKTTNSISSRIFETFLPRLVRDAWTMVIRLRQARNEYAASFLTRHNNTGIMSSEKRNGT